MNNSNQYMRINLRHYRDGLGLQLVLRRVYEQIRSYRIFEQEAKLDGKKGN
jgi:hypothetical protein